MVVKVTVYDRCKYNINCKVSCELWHDDIKKIEIKVVPDNEAEALFEGIEELDEFSEYVTFYNEDGSTATFRNSHVDFTQYHD